MYPLQLAQVNEILDTVGLLATEITPEQQAEARRKGHFWHRWALKGDPNGLLTFNSLQDLLRSVDRLHTGQFGDKLTEAQCFMLDQLFAEEEDETT